MLYYGLYVHMNSLVEFNEKYASYRLCALGFVKFEYMFQESSRMQPHCGKEDDVNWDDIKTDRGVTPRRSDLRKMQQTYANADVLICDAHSNGVNAVADKVGGLNRSSRLAICETLARINQDNPSALCRCRAQNPGYPEVF